MKNLLLLPLMFLGLSAKATNYYIAANGNDANNGTSPSTPWKTINKVNSITLRPGDNLFFNRGDVFYGGITIKQSGTAGSPITISAYGSGSNPEITGFTTITSWNNLGGNIWESSAAVSNLNYAAMVSIDGVNTPMGRFPNSGYLAFQSHSGTQSITSNQLTGSTNWKGAELVIKKERWEVNRCPITSQSGSTLYYTPYNQSQPKDGWGFFIQNDPKTLDSQGEWYYNPSTKKLRVYSIGTPRNVRIATVEDLVSISKVGYITINNITFTGGNSNGLNLYTTNTVTLQNCNFFYFGMTAVYGDMATKTTVESCNIKYINRTAVFLRSYGSNNSTIKSNNISNILMFPGMTVNSGGGTEHAISTYADNILIQYNTVDSTGYGGISFRGNNVQVKNNLVENFCFIFDDGGGIYTAHADESGKVIDGNIVLNSRGSGEGTSSPTSTLSQGIFIDDNAESVTVSNNTVANGNNSGIKVHNGHNLNINNNTLYNNGGTADSKGAIEFMNNDKNLSLIRDVKVNNNIFFAKTDIQLALLWTTVYEADDIKQFGTADNNYYARPIKNDNSYILIFTASNKWPGYSYSVSGWQTFLGQDIHSKATPKTITDVGDLRFEYNASTSAKTIKLDGNYIDVKNVSYNGTITLAPYTSAVLIRNGAIQNQSPTANAGVDQNITLPSSSTVLNGSGTDIDGSISSYAWTKLSGPAGGVIATPASASTSVSSLVQGTYQFVLKVTDNAGASGFDTIKINVNASSNSIPSVNAGDNQSISLPSNTVTLSGNGSLSGGTISSYSWSEISGPSSGVINNPNSATTSVTGLVEGVYTFQLKLTASNGMTNTDNVQIVVSAQGTLLPAINPSNVGSGLDYKYYEGGSFSVLPDFTSMTPVKTGNVSDFDITVSNRSEIFALKFSGYINIPTDGQYTFYTTSDDGSSLYIDGVKVVDNDGIHGLQERSGVIGLKAGKHEISVEYFQQTGYKELDVEYAGPGISKKSIPDSELSRPSLALLPAVNPSNLVTGIDYKYYEAASYSQVPDFTSISPLKVGSSDKIDISVANRAEAFALNFTGYVNVPVDGQYTFYTLSDDGSNLFIDGIKVVDNDGIHYNTEMSGTIGLKAGKHQISIGYFQQTGGKILQVSYEGPGISKQQIPTSSLYRVEAASDLLPALNPANLVKGLDYSYYEGSGYSKMPDFSSMNPVKTGTVTDFDISVANRDEIFAVTYEGYVNIPADGQYEFYTSSDDGSLLFIDSKLVVNNDGIHGLSEKSGGIGLKAGMHSITVQFFQQTGSKYLTVSFSGPGLTKQRIQGSSLFRAGSTDGLLPAINPGATINGLDYKYYQGALNELPDFSTLTPVKTGSVANFDISPSSWSEAFSFNFSGYIEVPSDGQYTFYTLSDDGSNLFIDGIKVVDNDGVHYNTEKSGSIGLKAGKHAINLGYFQRTGGKILQVSYAGPGIAKQLIPNSALYRLSNANSRTSSINGTAVLTDVTSNVAVDIDSTSMSKLTVKIAAYPNPFINSIKLNISGQQGSYHIMLIDELGRIMWARSGSKGDGTYQETINTSSIQTGTYFLRVLMDNGSSVIKVQKMR